MHSHCIDEQIKWQFGDLVAETCYLSLFDILNIPLLGVIRTCEKEREGSGPCLVVALAFGAVFRFRLFPQN